MLKIFRKAPKKQVINSLSNINALVREGNDYLSDRVIFLDQKLFGNLFCSENIFIEKDGQLDGNICSKHCVIGGVVNGNISATELLEITKTAVIKGKVRATSICIEPGAIVNGAITIGEDKVANATLTQRIKKHTADEYAELRAIDESSAVEITTTPITTIPKKEPASAEAPIAEQPAPVIEKQKVEPTPKEASPVKQEHHQPVVAPTPAAEQIINEEPAKTPAPQPEKRPANGNKPKEENIQRWW